MEKIRIICSSCQKTLSVPLEWEGKKVRCTQCLHVLEVSNIEILKKLQEMNQNKLKIKENKDKVEKKKKTKAMKKFL